MRQDILEIHGMDRRLLRQFGTDVSTAGFRKDYRAARQLWEDAGLKGGLYDATLFAMAMKNQAAEPVVEAEPAVVEAPSFDAPVYKSPKKKTAKKKQLAKV
jgi:hypothetical protein